MSDKIESILSNKKMHIKKIFFLLLLVIPCRAFSAGDTTYVTDQKVILLKDNAITVFTDITNRLPFKKIKTITAFHPPHLSIPNVGVSRSTSWFRFTLINKTNQDHLLINLKDPHLNYVKLYYPLGDGDYTYLSGGDILPISQHKFNNQGNLFKVPIAPDSAGTFYVSIKTMGPAIVPVYVGTTDNIITRINWDDIAFGIYMGIILIMIFYNLFIYFSVRDESYLYYIGFIFSFGFSQICIKGYGYRILWSAAPFITSQSINWAVALSGIAGILFCRVFLQTKVRSPLFDKILVGFIMFYAVSILLTLFGLYNISYIIIDIFSFIDSFALLGIAVKYSMEGFRPAKFFLIAWSFLLVGAILYVIKDFNVIPYNFFTNNVLLIGSSIEIALLSFALADEINTYKAEKEISQAKALQVSLEKEQFVKDQNIMLESRIATRTYKLQQLNSELQIALDHLKRTQSQLVEAEKMASLGQLIAGIAHEINNPMNFVKSNIKPLQRDILDIRNLLEKYDEIDVDNIKSKLEEIGVFKKKIEFGYVIKEIETLLAGIGEGASRTADIIKGLRIFSRVDENEIKKADIHEGIDTTLMLLTHRIPPGLSVVKNYAELPEIECYPGNLNQVFMNILTNAIQAVTSKADLQDEKIVITTRRQGNHIIICIADTGPGIPDELKDKIFEPFFTTKEVGEGTGLGLSITYGIIKKHHGKIVVRSGKGMETEFIITLPIKQNMPGNNTLTDEKPSPPQPGIHH